jgi:four helix bundle protein
VQRFTDLRVWQRSHALVLDVYATSAGFPREETYGLTSQLRRAAVSVPANIAEGTKRRSRRAYAHSLNIAESSLAETEYLVMLSRELSYLDCAKAAALNREIREIASMLSTLRSRVESGALDFELSTLDLLQTEEV